MSRRLFERKIGRLKALRQCFVVADFGEGNVVFNIKGNTYRLVAWIDYEYKVIFIRFIGTHKQYDKIDAKTI